MTWAVESWLWLLPLVLALGVALVIGTRRALARLESLLHPEMAHKVVPPTTRVRRILRDVFAAAGLVAVVIALAEPRFDKEVVDIQREGLDVVLAVDLSLSMAATDVDPSRYERSRREIADLLELLQGDRVGLVMYAGAAYARVPLTLDYEAIAWMIPELTPDAFQYQGSDLGGALRMSADLFPEDAEADKAVIVLSDGEAHDPDDVLAAATELAEQGVHVYGLGIGVRAAPVPDANGGFKTDASGQTVLSTPSFDLLKDVARITGGGFVPSVASDADLRKLYLDELRGRLATAQLSSRQREVWKSGYQLPLGVGLMLCLAAVFIGDGRAAAVLLALLVLAPTARAASRADGDRAYREGRYSEAVETFEDLLVDRPGDAELLDRLAAARYRSGDFEGAARTWDRIADGTGSADASYNAGNAHYRAGRLEQALQRYDEALQRQPQHPGASQNRQAVEAELQARREEQPPPQPQQDPSQQPDGEQGDPQQGEPQSSDGESGEGGDPQDGEPGEQSESGEEGSNAQASAEQSPGDQQSGGDPQQSQGTGAPDSASEPGDDPTREADDSPGMAGLDELDGEPGEPGEGSGGTPVEPWTGEGPMTEAQAERLLEGQEEGRPKVVVTGRNTGKDW